MKKWQRSALQAERAALWPPDDTEESVLGTNLHQTTITNTRLGLNEIASSLAAPGEPVPWQALSQTMVSGLQRYDGSPYTVLPDVFVYACPIDAQRASVTLAKDGPPVLVIEVASESTYLGDLDEERGKGWSYARAGVREYMVLDPTGEFVPEGVRAWRLEEGVYRPWLEDGDGRWRSREIAAAIALEGATVAVYTLDGRRMLREGEITRELTREARQHAEELAREARDHAEELARETREHAEEMAREARNHAEELARETREHAEELARKEAEIAALRRLLEQRNADT